MDLKQNGIKTIESGAFNNLPALTELILDMNQINTIETGTFNNLPELETICLEVNLISKLKTGSFNCLKNLTYKYCKSTSCEYRRSSLQ